MREQVFLFIASWYTRDIGPSGLVCSLPAVEKEIIALASVNFKNILLNVNGV